MKRAQCQYCMFHCGLDVADLQHYPVPEAAVHQTVGAGDSFLAEVLEVAFLQHITESWLSKSRMKVSVVLRFCIRSYDPNLRRSRYEQEVLTRLPRNPQKLSLPKKRNSLRTDLVERKVSCYSHRNFDQCSGISRMRASFRRT
jgi:hypothetical protein